MTKPPDPAATLKAFNAAVNMTPAALRKWLATEDSHGVGMLPNGTRKTATQPGESVGHHMGKRILELKATRRADLTNTDFQDMAKVTNYVHRHLTQRPTGDVTDLRWRKSLMNWGHDPLK